MTEQIIEQISNLPWYKILQVIIEAKWILVVRLWYVWVSIVICSILALIISYRINKKRLNTWKNYKNVFAPKH